MNKRASALMRATARKAAVKFVSSMLFYQTVLGQNWVLPRGRPPRVTRNHDTFLDGGKIRLLFVLTAMGRRAPLGIEAHFAV
jgi:hypothetical protein